MADQPNDTGNSGKPTVVTGVVHPRGSAIGTTREQDKVLFFAFETWRGEDGNLHRKTLNVRGKVSLDNLNRYRERVQPHEILIARVVFIRPAIAELLELLDQPANTDTALVQRAAELQQPKTFEHDRFGTFTLDRKVEWYEATTTWEGKEIRLTLDATDDTDVEAALQAAIALWNDQSTWNERIQEYAVQKLLNLKNESWLEKDEAPLTSGDFISRMRLETIGVRPDGKFDFWYDDGDLFFGHSILVSGKLGNGLTRADLFG